MVANEVICNKCMGAKRIYAFYHVEEGVCFACKGSGKVKARTINRVFPKAEADNTRTVTRGDVSLVINDQAEMVIVMYRGEIQGQANRIFNEWEFSCGLDHSRWNAVKRAIRAGV